MTTKFSTHYYKIVKKSVYQHFNEQRPSVIVQKLSRKLTMVTPEKFTLVLPMSQDISQFGGEIIKVDQKHFDCQNGNIFIANKHFQGFKTYTIDLAANMTRIISKKHALVVENRDTFKSHDYVVLDINEKLYQNKNRTFLRVKKYPERPETPEEYNLVFTIHSERVKVRIGEVVFLYGHHFDKNDSQDYVTNLLFKECESRSIKLTDGRDKSDNKTIAQNPISPYSVLPSHFRFLLSWDKVHFQNGYIIFCSPYSEDGGLGKRIKWAECSIDYEKVKSVIAKVDPIIHVRIENGNIVEVYNIDHIMKAVVRLNRPTPTSPQVVVRKESSVVKINSLPERVNLKDLRNAPEVKSSRYLKELCKLHISDYPVYYCTERKDTKSGTASPEKAFLFILKKTDTRMMIIFENTIESRSSYVFVIRQKGYIETIQRIHKFFVSDLVNKREKMASYRIDFKSPNILSYYRIIHNTFYQWNQDIRNQLFNLR